MLAAAALSGAVLAGAPGAAATRVCPEGVPVAAPETPNDAANQVIATVIPDDEAAVTVCYDSENPSCSRVAAVASLCVAEKETTYGEGDCGGSAYGYRETEIVLASTYGPVRPFVRERIVNECDSSTGAGRLWIIGTISPVVGNSLYWTHTGTQCGILVGLSAPFPSAPVPCVPVMRPVWLPGLP